MSLTTATVDASVRASCAELTRAVGEPLAGTATQASVWIAVSDPGPYARKAVPDALPPALAGWLSQAGKRLRLQLIRRPVLREERSEAVGGPRTVFVAQCDASPPRLAQGTVRDLDELARWDVEALLTGEIPPGLQSMTEGGGVYLVCTNGRRDPCCARFGRQAVAELLQRHPGRVWETSHVGGHRFAPSVVRLPDGFLFGGPGASGETLGACRGRSMLDPDAQTAELAVLAATGAAGPRPLSVASVGAGSFVVADGAARWAVRVVQRTLDAQRPESCDGEDQVVVLRHASTVEELETA